MKRKIHSRTPTSGNNIWIRFFAILFAQPQNHENGVITFQNIIQPSSVHIFLFISNSSFSPQCHHINVFFFSERTLQDKNNERQSLSGNIMKSFQWKFLLKSYGNFRFWRVLMPSLCKIGWDFQCRFSVWCPWNTIPCLSSSWNVEGIFW